MATKMPQEGLLVQSNAFIAVMSGAWKIRLFNAAHTPAVGDTLSTYTAIEASFAGYPAGGNALPLPPTYAWDSGNSKYIQTFPYSYFTYTGGTNSGNIYGYFIDDGAGHCVWAESFPGGPVILTASYPTLSLQCNFDNLNEY